MQLEAVHYSKLCFFPLMHRYDPKTGILRLVSERYINREDNRRHIIEQISSLADEGRRLFPNPREEADIRSYRERCRQEAEQLGKVNAAQN